MNNIILHNYQLNQLNHTMSDKLYGLNKKKYGNSKKKILNDKNTPKSNERLLDLENKKCPIFNNYSVNQHHKSKKISYILSKILFFNYHIEKIIILDKDNMTFDTIKEFSEEGNTDMSQDTIIAPSTLNRREIEFYNDHRDSLRMIQREGKDLVMKIPKSRTCSPISNLAKQSIRQRKQRLLNNDRSPHRNLENIQHQVSSLQNNGLQLSNSYNNNDKIQPNYVHKSKANSHSPVFKVQTHQPINHNDNHNDNPEGFAISFATKIASTEQVIKPNVNDSGSIYDAESYPMYSSPIYSSRLPPLEFRNQDSQLSDECNITPTLFDLSCTIPNFLKKTVVIPYYTHEEVDKIIYKYLKHIDHNAYPDPCNTEVTTAATDHNRFNQTRSLSPSYLNNSQKHEKSNFSPGILGSNTDIIPITSPFMQKIVKINDDDDINKSITKNDKNKYDLIIELNQTEKSKLNIIALKAQNAQKIKRTQDAKISAKHGKIKEQKSYDHDFSNALDTEINNNIRSLSANTKIKEKILNSKNELPLHVMTFNLKRDTIDLSQKGRESILKSPVFDQRISSTSPTASEYFGNE